MHSTGAIGKKAGPGAWAVLLLLSFMAPATSPVWAADPAYHDEEIRDRFSRDKNMSEFNRLSGLLSDLLREQNRFFGEKMGAAENGIAAPAEELINDANMLAMGNDYEGAYAKLAEAYRIIKESLVSLEKLPAK